MASSKDMAEAALRKEGVSLKEDFTRLSKTKTVAEKSEAFWGQETHRLGRQVVRTRATLDDQLKLVLEKRHEVEKAQRVLKQVERDLGRQRSVLSQEESELKDSETAQRLPWENCKVR
jgi:phage-related tail protein